MTLVKKTIFMLLFLMLTGCASNSKYHYEKPNTASYKTDPNYSLAMNVLMASGIVDNPKTEVVRDIPSGEDLAKSWAYDPWYYYKLNLPGKDEINPSHPLLASTELGLLSSGALAPPTGIGLGPAIGFSALWLLSGSSNNDPREIDGGHPLEVPLLIAWIDNPRKWYWHWTKAVVDALNEENFSPYKTETVHRIDFKLRAPWISGKEWKNATLENSDSWGIVKVTGGACWKGNVFCFYYPRKLIRKYYKGPKVSLVWPINTPPDFVKDNKRLLLLDVVPYDLVRDKGKQVDVLRSNSQINDPNFPFFNLFKGISKRLPESYFIYLPPGISLGPGKGKTRYPVVLNQGRELKFIRPSKLQPAPE